MCVFCDIAMCYHCLLQTSTFACQCGTAISEISHNDFFDELKERGQLQAWLDRKKEMRTPSLLEALS